MKKSIKAELVSLAHKILQLRDTANYNDLSVQARELHEKLIVLAYAEKLENTNAPTISLQQIEEAIKNTSDLDVDESTLSRKRTPPESNTVAVPNKIIPVESPQKSPAEILAENQARFQKKRETEDDYHRPDGTQFNTETPVHEPVIEKIKDMWTEMTPEAADIDKVIESIIPKEEAISKNDSFEIGSEFGQTPVFEPKSTTDEKDKPQNLNQKLKSNTFKIGLNDKLSFIKHLFNGSAADYNRVLSQLETFQTAIEAQQFVSQMIKPDYQNWQDKEVQEERFMQIIEARYN